VKQVTQPALNTCFHESHPEPKPWVRSDLAKAVLGCPPLALPSRDNRLLPVVALKGKEGKGAQRNVRTAKILTAEQLLRKIQSA